MGNPTPHPFESSQALKFGWQKTRENLKPLLVLGAVAAFLALLSSALSQPRGAVRSLLWLWVQVLQVGVTLAYVRTALRVHDGKPLELSPTSALLEDFFSFLLVSILYGLIVSVGMLLLIVPGVIWAIQFAWCAFLVVDKKVEPVDALRESSRLTRGHKGQLLGFGVLLFLVNLVGMLALGIGLLVTIPTTVIAGAYVFRRLQARAGAAVPEGPTTFSKPAESH